MNEVIELTEKTVNTVFSKCILQYRPDISRDYRNNKDAIFVIGTRHQYLYSKQGIEECRESIYSLLNALYFISNDKEMGLKELKRVSETKNWTEDSSYVEKLITMGIATEYLKCPYAKDSFNHFEDQFQRVISTPLFIKKRDKSLS